MINLKNIKKDIVKNQVITDKYSLFQADCMGLIKAIPDKSVDMIFCDLPYSVTRNGWDVSIPLNDYIEVEGKRVEKEEFYLIHALDGKSKKEINSIWKNEKIDGLWTHYNRIIKDEGVIVLFAQDMFSAQLMNSNPKMYRYKLYWEKDRPSGFLNAKRMPLRNIEEILVFYKKLPTYNPQFWKGKPLHGMGTKFKECSLINNNYGEFASHLNPSANRAGDTKKYPRQLLKFNRPHPPIHPTQKPTDLCSWIIRTFTNEGAVILDNTMGSGSIGVSAVELNRLFVGIELDGNYFSMAEKRIANIKKLDYEQIKMFAI